MDSAEESEKENRAKHDKLRRQGTSEKEETLVFNLGVLCRLGEEVLVCSVEAGC